MKALHVLPRAMGAASLVLALLCTVVPRHVGAASGSPSLAGHWVYGGLQGLIVGIPGRKED